MITLYIPTTTLNFNNILSSESISPRAFYERREFGYKRWTPIEENNNDNAIFLYDSLPIFERPDNGLEDHPLTVQVTIDENQVKEISDGIYYSAKTIYLDPWHTRFIFQSELDKRTTLSMSDSSSETKLLRLYRNHMDTRKGEKKYNIPVEHDIKLNEEEIYHDFSLNRIKGLLYGYYIGANMSLRKEDVEDIASMRELQDILSSIQSSDDHIPSLAQRERLHNILGVSIFLYGTEISNGQMLARVESSLLQLEHIANSKEEMLLPDSHEIEVVNSQISSAHTIQNDKELSLFKAWTNFLFSFNSCNYNGKISTVNKELSDELTVIAKTVYGDEWEGSHAKSFLNNLRRHIRGEAFEEKWNNGLLSSLASVLTHGDDWHKLLMFMQSKGMYDYRIAFAIYGALNGFANLTRDFTDLIFNKSSEYIAQTYKEFYKQIFGIELKISKGNLSVVQVLPLPNETHVEQTEEHHDAPKDDLIDHIRAIASTMKLSNDQSKNLNMAISQINSSQSASIFLKILSQLPGWKSGKKLKTMKEKLLSHSHSKQSVLKVKNESKQPDLFSSQDLSISARPMREDKDSTYISKINETEPIVTENRPGSLKDKMYMRNDEQNLHMHFAYDKTAWDKIEDLIPLDVQEKIYKDFDWFISEMRKEPYERYRFYRNIDSNDDKRVIESFVSLKSQPDNKGRLRAPYFTPELRQKIRNRLLSLYCK